MITVISGPPCSGKSTYARERAKPGDVVIDFDQLAQALGSPASWDHDPRIREVTAAAWSAAVTRLVTGFPDMRAWIIDARPTRPRIAMYQRARARMVTLSAPAGELHRRADAGGQAEEDRHKRIDAYLAASPPGSQPAAAAEQRKAAAPRHMSV